MARQLLKNAAPILIGFVIGSMISLFIIPTAKTVENHCPESNSRVYAGPGSVLGQSSKPSFDIPRQPDIHEVAKPPASKTIPKTNRPRFYATELNVKDKLFVGVVTSKENLATLATAINKTVAHHVSKLMFFVDAPLSSAPRYLNLVNIAAETPDNLKPFVILNYMAGRGHALANNYDWFFFMPDSVYLKAFKLFELVSHMSFGYDVHMGRLWLKKSTSTDSMGPASPYCDFNAGILLSFGLMRSVLANLRQCMKRVDPASTASENFGRCILYANAEATCSEDWSGKLYRSWPLSDQASFDLRNLAKHDSFNSALTVYPVASVSNIFRLHKYYCNQEIEQINQLINTLEQNLVISALADNASEQFSWPPGLPAQARQRSRYELLKWDYFTETDIFETNSDQNVRQLSGSNRKDIKDVVDYAARSFVVKHPYLNFRRLLNGYRRFDPKRGMDYMLDLHFDISGSVDIQKRVHLIRPLNKVELIPAPYVTEATPVTVVVAVSPDEADAARKFLNRFSKFCLDADESATLIFVLFYDARSDQDSYQDLRIEIENARKKYGFGEASRQSPSKTGGLELVYFRSGVPSPFMLMDLMLQTIGRDHLYLLATPWTEVYGDFLNRVRMNTIKEFQVFFPIPFVQFNPKIVYRQRSGGVGSPPDHIDVHRNAGRFDKHDFSICSFYGSDYSAWRHKLPTDNIDQLHFDYDILSIFLNSTVHVFRAVEPALKIRYHDKHCDPRTRGDLSAKCLSSRKEGLGTKAHLAGLLSEFGAIDDGL